MLCLLLPATFGLFTTLLSLPCPFKSKIALTFSTRHKTFDEEVIVVEVGMSILSILSNVSTVIGVFLAFIAWSVWPIWFGLLLRFFRWIGEFTYDISSKCRRMCWDDISDGQLNSCSSFLARTCHCSADNVEDFYQRPPIPANVRKPKQLPFTRRYVYADGFSLLGYVLCTQIHTDIYGAIEFEKFDKILVARTRGGLLRHDMTKKTLDGILNGYPPWYREEITIHTGATLPHPIKSKEYVIRAGWILAVGLSDIQPMQQSLMRKDLVKQVCERVLEKLKDAILPHFNMDENVKKAVGTAAYLVKSWTDSGLGDYVVLDQLYDFSALSKDEALFAMDLFNKVGSLTSDEVVRLTPILHNVISCALLGLSRVIKYYKNDWVPFLVPPEIMPLGRVVYVDVGPIDWKSSKFSGLLSRLRANG